MTGFVLKPKGLDEIELGSNNKWKSVQHLSIYLIALGILNQYPKSFYLILHRLRHWQSRRRLFQLP